MADGGDLVRHLILKLQDACKSASSRFEKAQLQKHTRVRAQNQRDNSDRQCRLNDTNWPESPQRSSTKGKPVNSCPTGHQIAFEPTCKIAARIILKECKGVPNRGKQQQRAAEYSSLGAVISKHGESPACFFEFLRPQKRRFAARGLRTKT